MLLQAPTPRRSAQQQELLKLNSQPWAKRVDKFHALAKARWRLREKRLTDWSSGASCDPLSVQYRTPRGANAGAARVVGPRAGAATLVKEAAQNPKNRRWVATPTSRAAASARKETAGLLSKIDWGLVVHTQCRPLNEAGADYYRTLTSRPSLASARHSTVVDSGTASTRDIGR